MIPSTELRTGPSAELRTGPSTEFGTCFELPDWAGYLRFRDQFERLLDPRCYTIGWLDQQVLSGAFRPFVGERGAILVSIKTYPTWARELHGEGAAIELPGALQEVENVLIPQAEDHGRKMGCEWAEIASRPVWDKRLKSRGYEQYQLSIRKDLR